MPTTWRKSLPTVSAETKPFWDAALNGKFLLQRCRNCNKYQTHYRAFCCHCWSTDVEDVEASGKGSVWAHSVAYQNRTPGWVDEVPYVVAQIELEEGVRVISNVINCDPESVKIDMPVKVTFVKATDDIAIPYFEPV